MKYFKNIKIFLAFGMMIFIAACYPKSNHQASGILERDRVSLTATASEIILSLPKSQGDTITKGDILVQLDDYAQKVVVAKTLAQQAQAQANLAKLLAGNRIEDIEAAKADLDSANAKLIDAQGSYKRAVELYAKKLVSQANLDNALAQKDAAQATYNAANLTWKKLSSGNRKEDIDAAKAQLAAAEAELSYQQHQLENLSVRATRDGILDSLPYNEGERVNTGSVVAIIQADTIPYGRIYVLEPYRSKFMVGKEVKVYIDGVEKPMVGKLRWISVEPAFTPYKNMSEEDRSRLVYLAEIALPQEAKDLAAGIPLQVDLE